jgi:hypothetical protein
VIVDASLVIDAAGDPGPRGRKAREALDDLPDAEPLITSGHFAIEVLSGLKASANRPGHLLRPDSITEALADAQALDIRIEATPWPDVHRAWELSGSLRYSDARIERSGAPFRCGIRTVTVPVG